jgi:predicted Zn-dependent peptidase
LAGEDSLARMSRLGSSLLLHGEIRTVDQIIQRIEAVASDEVRAVAGALASAPKVLSVVGPFDASQFDPKSLQLA